MTPKAVLILATLATAAPLTGAAQTTAADGRPPILRAVGLDQRLDAQVPLDVVFRDERGVPVQLGALFRGKPVILTLNYYACPMLCTLVLNDVLRAMRAMPLTIGRDFEVLTVSFDPRETPALAADKKRAYVEGYRRTGAAGAWHFLTGEDRSIRALTDSVGFRYVFDPSTEQFAHPSGIIVLTPTGRVSRYFYGLEYSPRDLRLALVEASANRIGSLTDQLLLFCFHYDPTTGTYGFLVTTMVRVAGVVTVLVLGAFLLLMFRRERGRRMGAPTASPAPR